MVGVHISMFCVNAMIFLIMLMILFHGGCPQEHDLGDTPGTTKKWKTSPRRGNTKIPKGFFKQFFHTDCTNCTARGLTVISGRPLSQKDQEIFEKAFEVFDNGGVFGLWKRYVPYPLQGQRQGVEENYEVQYDSGYQSEVVSNEQDMVGQENTGVIEHLSEDQY